MKSPAGWNGFAVHGAGRRGVCAGGRAGGGIVGCHAGPGRGANDQENVDLLLRAATCPTARAAAQGIGLDYFEVLGVGMLLERGDPHPRRGVHLIWAGEKVRPEYEFPAPQVGESLSLAEGIRVVALPGLVRMKPTSYRDQDRLHLRDMIGVGLIDRALPGQLPLPLAARLEGLLLEAGR